MQLSLRNSALMDWDAVALLGQEGKMLSGCAYLLF